MSGTPAKVPVPRKLASTTMLPADVGSWRVIQGARLTFAVRADTGDWFARMRQHHPGRSGPSLGKVSWSDRALNAATSVSTIFQRDQIVSMQVVGA